MSLRRNWFYVLLALAEKERHGSDIVRDVLDETDDRLRLWPATLYSALDDMVEAGLIEELGEERRPTGVSERRRYFGITSEGRRVLSQEAAQLARMADSARTRLRAETH